MDLTDILVEIGSFLSSNSSELTAGIIGGVIPGIIRNIKNRNEFNKIKKAFETEYTDSINNLIDKYNKDVSNEKSDDKLNDTKEKISKKAKKQKYKLKYFKENELPALNSDNKFKIIRMVEQTWTYFVIIEAITDHLFVVHPEDNSYLVKHQRKANDYSIVKNKYKKTLNDYINLRTSSLLDDSDLDSINTIIFDED